MDTGSANPNTNPQSSGGKILEREFVALASCLKDAVIKTGQIYGFYSDTRKLHIEKHVSNPPRSLTTALGRDIELYDQLCDSVEAHLHRAISTLKRDLKREEAKIEAESRRKNAEALMLPPALPAPLPSSDASTSQPLSEGSSTTPRNSPVLSTAPARRQSAISISSLHRPNPPPLKIDLSGTALRITEEEASQYSKGLASPVTLAPKSARPVGPNEFPPELMAAFAASSAVPLDGNHDLPLLDLGVGMGDSSDKPIELDLDAMDIQMASMAGAYGNPVEAGESGNSNDGLFSPLQGDGGGIQQLEGDSGNSASQMDGDTSSNFQVNSAPTDELFGDFAANTELGGDLNNPAPSVLPPSSVPSPASLLAQFNDASSLINGKMMSSDNPTAHDADNGFDINNLDLSISGGFFSTHGGNSDLQFMTMDMNDFLQSENELNMDSLVEPKEGEANPKS